MKNVGDGKIVLKGRDHQHYGCEENYCEARNARATRSFTQPSRSGSLDDKRQQTCKEGIGTQRQREEERKTAYLRHGGNLGCIFSETIHRSNQEAGTSGFSSGLFWAHS